MRYQQDGQVLHVTADDSLEVGITSESTAKNVQVMSLTLVKYPGQFHLLLLWKETTGNESLADDGPHVS